MRRRGLTLALLIVPALFSLGSARAAVTSATAPSASSGEMTLAQAPPTLRSAVRATLATSSYDPFGQVQMLTASDAASGDHFGTVAISGNTALVGAENAGSAHGGAVYVFTRSGDTWTQQQELTIPGTRPGLLFGKWVALSGSTALIGGSDATSAVGAVYVFTRSGGVWTEQQELTVADGVREDRFGATIALSGTTAFIGASGKNASSGAVYVFTESGGTWTEQQEIDDPANTAGDWFGGAVALSGSTALVGSLFGEAAYVFTESGTTWVQQQQLTEPDAGDFGYSVALSGDTALIGAIFTNASQGAAYVFTRSGSTWTEEAELTASDPGSFSYLGVSVGLSGSEALVGQIGRRNGDGAVYVFADDGAGWAQQQKITDPPPANSLTPADGFGQTLTVSGTTALIGAPLKSSTGVVYVYGISAGQVSVSLGGPGTVTSTPAGISCPGTCKHTFPIGTSVTLHETPTPNGKSFLLDWVGCASQATPADCTVTTGTSRVEVLASFAALSATIDASLDHTVTNSPAEHVFFDGCSSFVDPNQAFVYVWQVAGLPAFTATACGGESAGGYTASLQPGDYPVSLTVRNGDGSLSATANATVKVRPFASFAWGDETVSDPGQSTVPVDVDACASGGVVSYRWVTPAGTTTTSSCRTTLQLPVGNSVPISLIASDSTGAFSVEVDQTIAVVASTGAPCPAFAFGPDACWRQGAGWFGDAFSGPTRNPDYAMVTFSAGGEIASLSTTFVLTCDGNSYASGSVDLSAGLGSLPVSGSVAFGYVGSVTGPPPTMADIDSYVQNETSSVSAGIGAGFNFTQALGTTGPNIGVEYWRGADATLAVNISAGLWSNSGPENQTPPAGAVCENGAVGSSVWLATHNIPVTPNTAGAPVANLVTGTTPVVDGGFYVMADGFAPDSAVTITLHSTPYQLATVAADDQGRIGVPLTLPDGISSGDHTVTATGFDPSGDPLVESTTIHVISASVATTTLISSSANPSVVGQPVTYTATVTPTPGAPAGEVAFSDGAAPIAGCEHRAVSSAGAATCATAYSTPGVHSIAAAYSGTAGFDPSGGSLTQTVARAATTVSLSFNPSAPRYGSPESITATVSPVSPGAGTPTGSISFFEGGQALGQASLVGGQASISALLRPGSQTIRAVYSGDTNFTGSDSAVSKLVGCTASLAGTVTGGLTVGAGQSVCLPSNVTVRGAVKVNPGGALYVGGGSSLSGTLTASGAAAIELCASSVSGGAEITNTTGFVLLGDAGDDGTPGCGPNTISGSLSLVGNRGGLEVGGNTVSGSVTVNGTIAPSAPPFASIAEDLRAPEVEANVITGTLSCSGNAPPPVNDGRANVVKGKKSGQCSGL